MYFEKPCKTTTMKTIVTSFFTSAFIAVITLAGCEKSEDALAPSTTYSQSYQINAEGNYLGELQVALNGEKLSLTTVSATEVAEIVSFQLYSGNCDSVRMSNNPNPQTPDFTWQGSFVRDTASTTLSIDTTQRCLCIIPIITNPAANTETQGTDLSLSTSLTGEPIPYCR